MVVMLFKLFDSKIKELIIACPSCKVRLVILNISGYINLF